MAETTTRGHLLLTCAQAWHAFAGYLVFVTGARMLGKEGFADFGVVVWTMTTLEILVVDGVPRSVSWWTARAPEAARRIAVRGLLLTLLVAAALAASLAAAAPLLARFWRDPGLEAAIRISALDFVAFAGFAVLVQAVNGLHRFGVQAAVWMTYSVAKVLAVVGFLALGWGLAGGVLGFVVASCVGSLVAFGVAGPVVAPLRGAAAPDARKLLRFGAPVAAQAAALLALVNVDLWAAKHASRDDDPVVGVYTGAATLARALFFVFKAFGDVLFPAVSRAVGGQRPEEARRIAKKGLGQLCCLLVPLCGLASGAAAPTLVAVYGDAGYAAGAAFLQHLAPSAVAWTFTAVFALLVVAASGRPWPVALLLVALLGAESIAVFSWAAAEGPLGAARGSVVAGSAGVLVTGALAIRALGDILPLRALAVSVAGALVLDRALVLWAPPGWWVFPYGALLYAILLTAFVVAGVLPPPRNRRHRPSTR